MGGRFLASKKGNQVSFDFMKRQDEKVSASSYAFECLCVCVSVCVLNQYRNSFSRQSAMLLSNIIIMIAWGRIEGKEN